MNVAASLTNRVTVDFGGKTTRVARPLPLAVLRSTGLSGNIDRRGRGRTPLRSAFLRIFDYVYSMTSGQGGPLDSTKPLVLKIYETAFGHFQMGYAAAQSVVLFVILLG